MKTFNIPVRIVPPQIEIDLGIAQIRTINEEVRAVNKREAEKIVKEKYGIK